MTTFKGFKFCECVVHIYMFKVNNRNTRKTFEICSKFKNTRNTRKKCEIYSKLTIAIPEGHL